MSATLWSTNLTSTTPLIVFVVIRRPSRSREPGQALLSDHEVPAGRDRELVDAPRRGGDHARQSSRTPAQRRRTKPMKRRSTRRAVHDIRLAAINHIAATTGNDPDLDTLLLRLHTETACRRGGALALRPSDLDPEQCLILLHEKGGTTRWQPVSPTLMHALTHHANERSAAPPEQLLRYRNGHPITARRYDHLWTRIGHHLPWVATQQITTHWLRHTTLTWVERHHGYAIARAYAGHTSKNDVGTTTTYITADVHEVATALATLTNEPHPLAETQT